MRRSRCSAVLVAVFALTTGCADSPTLPPNEIEPQLSLQDAETEGLVHLWSGDGNANDAVGSAHGTLGPTTAFATGLSGQAFSFDGRETSIMDLPVNIGPGALPRMTMGMLVNLRSFVPGRLGWVLGHDDGGYDRSLALTDYRYGFGVAGGTGRDPHASSLIKLKENLNGWHCVAVSYDRYAGIATFYADGSTQTVMATPGEGRSVASLGGLRLFGNHTVDGLVDEVFMFNRVLTKGELDRTCDYGTPALTFAIEQNTLWPATHKMVTVATGISAWDLVDPSPLLTIEVTSNEAIDGTGDGNTDADWAVTHNADGTCDVQVRAERDGGGTGRVYTITATASDASGNSISASGSVAVPHDQGKGKGRDQ